MHSGIPEGSTIENINSIKKPYSPESSKLAADILWSQPSIYKEEYPVNNYSTQFRKLQFSQEIAQKFLTDNKLSLIIRSKDFLQSGFEKIFNSKVMTIFSASNYSGNQGNDGAILYVKRNLEILPKVLTNDETNVTWQTKNITIYPSSPKSKFIQGN